MLHFAEWTRHEQVGPFMSNSRPVSGLLASISGLTPMRQNLEADG